VTRFTLKISRWIRMALLPFKNPMIKAMLNFGGTLRHMWIWSGSKCPSNTSTRFWLHNSFKIVPTFCRNLPYNRLFRYLGTITPWYLQSHLTCDRLFQSRIGAFSSSAQGTSPEKEPILFLVGTVEPFRVHRHRRWV